LVSRKYLLISLGALALAAVVTVLLLAHGRERTGGEPREGASLEEVPGEAGAAGGEEIGPAAAEGGGPEASREGGNPSLVVNFPDPWSWGETAPGEDGQGICGRWVLEMDGEPLAMRNCHLLLEEDGGMALPPDYGGVMEMVEGHYAWEAGSGDFAAWADLVLKPVSGAGEVHLRVNLEGVVSGSLREITGSYRAVPGEEAYAPYAQQGAFRMRR
jgi:hypothetical protein